MESLNPGPRSTLGGVMLGGGALMARYWALYLGGIVDPGQSDPVVAAFESAFLLADTLLAALLLIAGWTLLSKRPSGPSVMTVAAAMSLYLGLLDFVYDSRHGLFDSPGGTALFELLLIATCVLGGGACLGVGWKLLAGGRS